MAQNAEQLTTVDFMADYVEKNRARNGHYAHVEFMRADVTELELPDDKKFDVIFSNWLLMYLSDDEIKALTRKMLRWLKDGGFLFVRESCFHPSGMSRRRLKHMQMSCSNVQIRTADLVKWFDGPRHFLIGLSRVARQHQARIQPDLLPLSQRIFQLVTKGNRQ